MPIKRTFSLNNDSIIFHVSDAYMVLNGLMALSVDHFLNHLGVLLSVAPGIADQSLADCLAAHPHYGVGKDDYADGAYQQTVTNIVAAECHTLLEYVTKIAAVDKEPQKQNALLDEVRAKIPFLSYGISDKSASPIDDATD